MITKMIGTSNTQDSTIELPRRLYLDTQFCFAYLVDSDPDHQAAADFSIVLKQLSSANLVTCYFSILTLDELAWKLGALVFERDRGQGAWRKADKARAFAAVRNEVADTIRDFIQEPWISVLRVHDRAYTLACSWMRTHNLKPADLCHMVLASTVGAAIVSNDGDFRRIRSAPVEVITY